MSIAADEVDLPPVVAEVLAVFESYERALLANDRELSITIFSRHRVRCDSVLPSMPSASTVCACSVPGCRELILSDG